MEIRPIRADEWQRWREARLRMLREEAAYFSTRYEDVVREPEEVWRARAAEAADGTDKVLFLDHGHIAEMGTFHELSQSNGRFAALLRASGILTDEDVRKSHTAA